MRLLAACVTAAVLFLGAGGREEPEAGVPILKVAPRSCLAMIGRGCLVRVRVEIARPTPEMFCPSVEITVYGRPACNAEQASATRGACDDYGEGDPFYHSKAEADCDPWREEGELVVSPPPPHGDGGRWVPPTRDVSWSWPYDEARRFVLGQGEWTVEVRVEQGSKKFTLRERVVAH